MNGGEGIEREKISGGARMWKYLDLVLHLIHLGRYRENKADLENV